MGLSIDKVFRFVQFVSNKKHRGWISPEEFNIGAEIAQLSLYSEKESMFMQTKKIGADMRPFSKKADVTIVTGKLVTNMPTDFRQLIRAYDSDYKRLEEITQAELPDIMDSEIIAPSAAYPVIVDRNDGLYVYPVSLTGVITVEYLSKPTTPEWDYTVSVSGRPVYASSTSIDFDFDEVLFLEIASRILEHVGLNLGNIELAQYQQLHQQKEAN